MKNVQLDGAAPASILQTCLEDRIQKSGAAIELGQLHIAACSPPALQQVFQNLISNAVNYNDKEECHIRIEYEEKGDDHHFAIEDNGPGIPRERRRASRDRW